jgi:predicted P-loop ATPase
VWDGTARLAQAPATYLGVEDSAYSRLVFLWWMVAAVARTYEPGCKMDNVLILEGEQGLRKSSALMTLAGQRWFSDTPIDLRSKDAFLSLHGRLVVELAELEALRKSDADRAKSFFTSSSDTYRPPYGKRSVTVPRGCVFAGTVNHAAYLKDDTGNRRYWPLACTRIDLESIARDRDQLWAEAVRLYRAGTKWFPQTPEEVAICKAEVAPRAEGDEWEAPISDYMAKGHEPTVGEVLYYVFGLEKADWDRQSQMRVAGLLQSLGYTRRHRATCAGAKREWRYVQKDGSRPKVGS